jgi:hypothetical protein
MYARSIHHILIVVADMICHNEDEHYSELIPHIDRNYRIIDEDEYSIGQYKIVSDKELIITELPYRIWTENYLQSWRNSIAKKPKKQSHW